MSNISPTSTHIKLITDKSCDELHQFNNGYVKLSTRTKLSFTLDEQRNICANLKFSTFTGCAGIFRSEFGIQVNDKPPIPISFSAKNPIQTATLIDVDHSSLYYIDKNFEYDCLRRLFKCVDKIRLPDEVVKFEDIVIIKNKLKVEQEMLEGLECKTRRKSLKKDKKKKSEKESLADPVDHSSGDCGNIGNDCQLFYGLKGIAVWREKTTQLYSAKMLHMIDDSLDAEGFQVVDYPEEYPSAFEVTNFIEQQGLAESLKSDVIFNEFKDIYNQHVLERFRRLKPSNSVGKPENQPKADQILSVVPLPLVLQSYEVNLGSIELNKRTETVIQFFFHGNSLAASLRTESFVPGLSMKFLQNAEADDVLKIVDLEVDSQRYSGLYQHRFQHETNGNTSTQPAVKRCHSFDFTSSRVHSRKIPTTGERNQIMRVYNEVMSTKPKEKEKPKTFVQSEIYQNSLSNGDSKIFQFKVDLMPSGDHFLADTELDEIVYLDVRFKVGLKMNLHSILYLPFRFILDLKFQST